LSFHRFAKWIGYAGGAVSATKYIKRPFATVTDWGFDAFVAKIPTGMANCGGNLCGGGGSAKFVNCCEHTHGSQARLPLCFLVHRQYSIGGRFCNWLPVAGQCCALFVLHVLQRLSKTK
jgi:hypothetical protein